MKKEANSTPRTISILFAGLLVVTFNLNNFISSFSQNHSGARSLLPTPMPTSKEPTKTPTPSKTHTPTITPTRTPTGTLTSSRYIVLDSVDVKYPQGTGGVYVTQNNTCVPTSQGGLHCIFTGSGYTDKSLRGIWPYASFHWSDNANAKNVYRYQIATINHTNTFYYGDLLKLEFLGSWLTDGYHEWSGIGSYGNCNVGGCELRAEFYLQGGYGTYTWTVDTYVAPVAIDINAPTVTATSTPTRTPLPTFTPTVTPTSTVTSTPTATPAPNSALTNVFRFMDEANSGAYSSIVTGDPTIRSDPNDPSQWSYMRVAAQRIINGNVYYVEIGWLKGAQEASNFIPRSYWAYRDINGYKNQDWEGYPGTGLAYNYMVKRTASETWSVYFNDLDTPDETIWLGWDIADRIFSGGEVPNGSQGMGDSENLDVAYLDPTGANWYYTCTTHLVNEDPSRYFVVPGSNCNSWRIYGNN